MTLDGALFLVDRAGTNYHSKGQDIGTRMKANDSVLVQRGDEHFQATYNGATWDKIKDTDLVLAWDGTKNRKVSGENFKALFAPIPVSRRHERYVKSATDCPAAGELSISYDSGTDETTVVVRDRTWTANKQLLNEQDVWLNNVKYKIISLEDTDCDGTAEEFIEFVVSGYVLEADDPAGQPIHIHNSAAELLGRFYFYAYVAQSTPYKYMCPGQGYYQSAAQSWGVNDSTAYYSKTDRNNKDVFTEIQNRYGNSISNDNDKMWIKFTYNNAPRNARPNIYNDQNIKDEKSVHNYCSWSLGEFFYKDVQEFYNQFIELYDRRPVGNYWLPEHEHIVNVQRPAFDGVVGTTNESQINDRNMYRLDSSGNLQTSINYFGLFVPWAVIDRHLQSVENSRLPAGDPFCRYVIWNNTVNLTPNNKFVYNGVVGCKFHQSATTQNASGSHTPRIQFAAVPRRELWN